MTLIYQRRRQVDQSTPGIHASNAPPVPDLIGFSPGSPINFNDYASEDPFTNDTFNVGTLAQAKKATPRKERVEGSTLEKVLGPATRHSRFTRNRTSPEPDQHKGLDPANKHVRFDLRNNKKQERKQAKRAATISDSGSDDPLTLDAAIERSNPSKTAATSTGNAVASPTSSNASPQTAEILDRFRNGKLDSESDDVIHPSAPVASSRIRSGRRDLLHEESSPRVEKDRDSSKTR